MNYFTRMKGFWLVASLMLLSGILYAQDQTVSGTVASDAEGPLPGVNVLLKGTTTGTVTDLEGNYRLNVPEGGDTLVFSSIGYANQEIAISGRSTIDVTLGEDIKALEEIVVIGYGTQEKRDATGAVASVSSEDFNGGVIASPEQLIQGKAAGVQITQASGEPGAGINIRIRGTASVRGGNNPLFVVDGVPLAGDNVSGEGQNVSFGSSAARNPLNFLNPDDIASIDILKDASATAIYGSRGANGVVLITTKSGKSGQGSLNYSYSFGVNNVSKKYDLLNGDEFLRAYANVNNLELSGDPLSVIGNPINAADSTLSELDGGARTDWQDQILRTAYTHNHSLSYGGGDEKGSYRFSASYTDQEGIVKESALRRITGRFNGNRDFINDRFNIATQVTVSSVRDDNIPITDNAGFAGDLLGATLTANPTQPVFAGDSLNQIGPTQLNPAALLTLSEDFTNTFRALGNVTLSFEITEGLSFRTVLGADRSASSRKAAYSGELVAQGIERQGRATFVDVNATNTLMENYFNYNGALSDNIQLDAVLGYSYQRFQNENKVIQAAGFRTNDLDLIINNLGAVNFSAQEEAGNVNGGIVGNSGFRVDELQSVFGRVNFNISDKYLVTATLRTDGSTRFGENNRYGYFPSFSFGWRLSDESFVPDLFDDLKLRAGYGVTGNQEFQSNRYTSRQRYSGEGLEVSPDRVRLNNSTLLPVAFQNPNLKWESTTQINVGIDYGFVDNRLRGSLDYYRRSTEDLLFQVESAQPAPNPFSFENIDADVINEGVEITIEADVVTNENFGWTISANGSYNDNRVENFSTIVNTGAINGQGLSGAFAQRIIEGQPLYAYFLRPFGGFDSEGQSIYPQGNLQQFVGASPIPVYNLGITNNFYLGNFDLTFFFNGQFDYDVYNNTANAFFTAGTLAGGRNVTSDVVGNGEARENAPDVSTRFLEDASFLRLQNATLGYNFDVSPVEFLSNLRVFVTGQNLFVITNYSGQDPEVNVNKAINGVPSLGIDYTPYPRARTILFGINVSF